MRTWLSPELRRSARHDLSSVAHESVANAWAQSLKPQFHSALSNAMLADPGELLVRWVDLASHRRFEYLPRPAHEMLRGWVIARHDDVCAEESLEDFWRDLRAKVYHADLTTAYFHADQQARALAPRLAQLVHAYRATLPPLIRFSSVVVGDGPGLESLVKKGELIQGTCALLMSTVVEDMSNKPPSLIFPALAHALEIELIQHLKLSREDHTRSLRWWILSSLEQVMEQLGMAPPMCTALSRLMRGSLHLERRVQSQASILPPLPFD